jgi:hypothetical protein
VVAVDHRFALSMPALMSAPSKKPFSSASSPILACSAFRSTGGVPFAGASPNTAARALEQLVLPVGDLVGVQIEPLGEFGQRLVAANGGQRNARLERRGVVTSGPSAHSVLRFLGPPARSQEQIVHLSRCPDFRGHLFSQVDTEAMRLRPIGRKESGPYRFPERVHPSQNCGAP